MQNLDEQYKQMALDILTNNGISEPDIIDFFSNPSKDKAVFARSFMNKIVGSMVKNGTYKDDMKIWYEHRICTAIASLLIEDRSSMENYTDERVIKSIHNFQNEIARLAQR